MANLKEKYTDPLSPIRQVGKSLTLWQNFTFKDSKVLYLMPNTLCILSINITTSALEVIWHNTSEP